MPHDTTFVAICGILFYIFAPEYFGYAAIALTACLGFPVMRAIWQTTKGFGDIPDGEDEKDGDKAEAE